MKVGVLLYLEGMVITTKELELEEAWYTENYRYKVLPRLNQSCF